MSDPAPSHHLAQLVLELRRVARGEGLRVELALLPAVPKPPGALRVYGTWLSSGVWLCGCSQNLNHDHVQFCMSCDVHQPRPAGKRQAA